MSTIWSDYVQTAEQLYHTRALRFRDEYAHDYKRVLGFDGCRDVLEIGCGPGALATALSKWYPNARITGLDRDERFLAYAGARHPSLRFVQGDATSLPFPNDSFDATISHTVQEHVETTAFLGEQFRVLRGGGAIAILSSRTRLALETEGFWDFPRDVQATIERVQPYLTESDRQNQVCRYPLSERELLLAVERAGFCDVSVDFIAVCNAPDSAKCDSTLAQALIESARYGARESALLIRAIAPDVVSEAERAAWLSAIDAACEKRLDRLKRGERLWDIGVSMIMAVRAVKR